MDAYYPTDAAVDVVQQLTNVNVVARKPGIRTEVLMSRMGICVAVALTLGLAGCSDEDGKATSIICSTPYRVSQTEPLTEVDHLRFDDEDSTQSMPYIYLELHGQFSEGAADNERALRLWVTPTGEDDVLVSQLFQLPLGESVRGRSWFHRAELRLRPR